MQCPKCGEEVDLSDAFCRGCGHALGSKPPVTKVWKAGPIRIEVRTVTHVICSGCHKEVPPGEKTCPSCGRPIPSIKTFTVGPIHPRAQLKIGLSKLSGIFSVGGLLIFLAAFMYVPVGAQHLRRQIPTLQGPWSALHFVAFVFWGLALLLLLADKLRN